jgi:ribosome biogenesis GTPase
MKIDGLVVKSTGSWYEVKTPDQQYACRIKGKFRLLDIPLTNPIAVGDQVLFQLEQDGKGIITDVLPRRNYVLRQSPHNRKQMHLIAANIDQACLIVTLAQPKVKFGFIDRFLLTVEAQEIPTHIIVNKADLYDEELLDYYQQVAQLYSSIGYPTHLVSANTGQGLEDLRTLLKDRRSLLSGHSGVGKSSLVNALDPDLDLRTGEISDYSEKGMHTTTFAELFPLTFGGEIIDTPGIKELGFINLSPQDVAHNFREFFALSPQCKFANCLHLNEPHCAVKQAVAQGKVSQLRYQSYRFIQDEVQQQNHWEQNRTW